MIYLFEDKQGSQLSALFRGAYTAEVASRFCYSNGNAKLKETAHRLLREHPEETVMTFIDITPDNKWTVLLYNELVTEYVESGQRILPVPIVCSEFYFIRSIANLPICLDKAALRLCIEELPWRESSLVSTVDDKKFCKNFEKFCKLYLLKAVKDCAKSTPGVGASNTEYDVFYTQDCPCIVSIPRCSPISVADKAKRYVAQFPCYPKGTVNLAGTGTLDMHKFIRLNHLLCYYHNQKINEFNTGEDCVERLSPLPVQDGGKLVV